MARVTVEDCIVQVPNRFELVLYAAQRAREISSGAELQVDRDRDKNPVVSLREIAEEKLSLPGLEEAIVKGLQRHIEQEQPEEEVTELMAGEQKDWVMAQADDREMADEDGAEEGDSDDPALNGDMAIGKGNAFQDVDAGDA